MNYIKAALTLILLIFGYRTLLNQIVAGLYPEKEPDERTGE